MKFIFTLLFAFVMSAAIFRSEMETGSGDRPVMENLVNNLENLIEHFQPTQELLRRKRQISIEERCKRCEKRIKNHKPCSFGRYCGIIVQ